ncbi:MAG: glycoside hydrolase [Clostridia bacterium]|nr:glycoside hydrolase [Clostridia bacterium]
MKNKIAIIIITVIYIALSLWITNFAIKALTSRYSPEKSIISFFDDDVVNLVIEDELIRDSAPPVIEGREILLPFDVIKNYIDDTIYYDNERAILTITSEDKVIRMNSNELQAYLNMEEYRLDVSSKFINGVLYVPVMAFKDIFSIEVTYLENDNVVIVDQLKNYKMIGYINNEQAVIRSDMSLYKPIYKVYNPNDITVTVYGTDGEWTKVRTGNGVIGYIESKYLKTEMKYGKVVIDIRKDIPGEIETIIFAWEAFYNQTNGDADITENDVLNIISPTWFKVADLSGNIESFAAITYVEKAHELGYQVWPLISNTFTDIDMTSEVLNNTDVRDNIIRQLVAYSSLYQLDGISLDFENIYLKDKDAYTQFIRELVPFLHKANIKLSVAVGIPGGSDTYSKCYDHEKIGEIADYVMVMTYDQYYGGSTVAGSQAQVSWMSSKLKETLKLVSNEKLVMGIPLYTRLWEITSERARNIRNYSIDGAKKLIEEKNASLLWDSESGQYVATYYEEGKTYKMWLEDESSLKEKVSLVNTYELRGICMWELNWGNDTIWDAISQTISKGSE